MFWSGLGAKACTTVLPGMAGTMLLTSASTVSGSPSGSVASTVISTTWFTRIFCVPSGDTLGALLVPLTVTRNKVRDSPP